MWHLTLHGGAFDGCEGHTPEDPQPVMIVWGVPPDEAATFDPHSAEIVPAGLEEREGAQRRV